MKICAQMIGELDLRGGNEMNTGVSVICACKNREQPLSISLTSWLCHDEIREIIIVDWSSSKSLEYLTNIDDRITVIQVGNQKYFNQPQPLNLAFGLTTQKYILKLDTDYVMNPYYNFFDAYSIDDNSFVSGKVKYVSPEYYDENLGLYALDKNNISRDDLFNYFSSYSPYYKYLTGLLYITRDNFIRIGGYNENLGKYYAYEDDELYQRLELSGLEHKKMGFDNYFFHIPHPDKKRTENFEGNREIDNDYEKRVRDNLSAFYSGQELEWQVEYAVSLFHTDSNKKFIGQVKEPYVKPKTKWKLFQKDERYYSAMMYTEEKNYQNKLENFPIVNFISLEESEDRRNHLQNQFSKFNISDIAPIISKRFDQSDDKVSGKHLNVLDGGTTGCVISHLKMLKSWYENTTEDFGFFCEDDISLEIVQYWNFSWEDFIENLPEDAECIQLCCVRTMNEQFTLRERSMYDWSVTAYIMTRNYVKKVLDRHIFGDEYKLDIPGTEFYPMPETVLFYGLGKVYAADLFVEAVSFKSTFTDTENIPNGTKEHHSESNQSVIDWWKNNGSSFSIEKFVGKSEAPIRTQESEEEKIDLTINKSENKELVDLLKEYSLDTENALVNFNLAEWYYQNGHTAPALSYFLRAAERSNDDTLAYESLIKGSHCYDKQGTRDGSAKSMLQQALCLVPTRPEAYFLLSRFSERHQWWQDCYIYADQALRFADFDSPPLRTDVEYPGKYAILFEKSLAGWWWGKTNESKDILLDLKFNHPLSEVYRQAVENNLSKFQITENDLSTYQKQHIPVESLYVNENNLSNNNKIDIVLQGKYSEITDKVIDEYLKLPFVNDIIVSCWENDKTSVKNSTRVKFIRNSYPETFGTDNRNLQIVSSFAGLREVKTQFSAKMRTDQIYSYGSMMKMYDFFMKNNSRESTYQFDSEKPLGKIFVAGIYPSLLFHPRDHIFWGYTEDLIALFDIPLEYNGLSDKIRVPKDRLAKYYPFYTRTETYIGAHYASKFNEIVNVFLLEEHKYLHDNAPSWEDAYNFSKELMPKMFKSFPRSGIDLEWPTKDLTNYPYDEQKQYYNECWSEDGI
jgi:hypothetical protein